MLYERVLGCGRLEVGCGVDSCRSYNELIDESSSLNQLECRALLEATVVLSDCA